MKYKIILFVLTFYIPLKAYTNDLKKTFPSAVLEAANSIVFINHKHGSGSGFIIKDESDRTFVVTAYHVVQEVIGKPDRLTLLTPEDGVQSSIIVIGKPDHLTLLTPDRKQIKIKQVYSYSKILDTVFLEVENYEGKGLTFAHPSSYGSGDVFTLGSFIDQIRSIRGVDFNNPSHRKTLNVITEENISNLRGFSGGPALNAKGEVIGMMSGGNRFYNYADVIKGSHIKNLLESPKGKTSAVNTLPYYYSYRVNQALRGNYFLDRSNFLRLDALAQTRSAEAQKTLTRLDIGQFIKLGISFYLLNMFAVGIESLSQAEGVGNLAYYSAYTFGSGYFSFDFCRKAFSHFRNKSTSIKQRNLLKSN